MKENNLKNTYFLAYGAVIAAIYVALTMAFQPISFGPVQFRIRTEALCILPFFTPGSDPGTLCRMLFIPICSAGQPDWISYSEAWQP